MKIESFYGVRVKTVEALSKSHSPTAISSKFLFNKNI